MPYNGDLLTVMHICGKIIYNDLIRIITEFEHDNQKLYESAWKSQFFSGMMMPIMQFVGNLGYVMVALLGGLFAIKGTIEVGDIQSFFQYIRNFTQPIQQIAQVTNLLQSSAAASERVFEFHMLKLYISFQSLNGIRVLRLKLFLRLLKKFKYPLRRSPL